jgi:hypothetical protein
VEGQSITKKSRKTRNLQFAEFVSTAYAIEVMGGYPSIRFSNHCSDMGSTNREKS